MVGKEDLTPDVFQARKAARIKVAEEYIKLQEEQKGKTHKEKYGGKLKDLVKQSIATMPWLNKEKIKAQVRRLKQVKSKSVRQSLESLASPEVSSNGNAKAGRPVGSTIQAKEDVASKKAKAKDLITLRLKQAQDKFAPKRVPPGTFEKIHKQCWKL